MFLKLKDENYLSKAFLDSLKSDFINRQFQKAIKYKNLKQNNSKRAACGNLNGNFLKKF